MGGEDFGYVLPREVGGVAVGDDLNDLAIDGDGGVALRLDVGIKDAERRVVLEEVRGLLHAASVVDRDHLQLRVLPPVPAPQEVAPDAPEPVDRHLQLRLCHSLLVTIVTAHLQKIYLRNFLSSRFTSCNCSLPLTYKIYIYEKF